MTYLQWFRSIAFALNDDEPGMPFQRYPLEDMLIAYNDAICLVGAQRPDLFTELRIVELQPGRWQDMRGCCMNVTDVLEQTDEVGNIIKVLNGSRETDTKVERVWNKPSCLNSVEGIDYYVNSVIFDTNMRGRFVVDPPVPCDVEAFVRIKCVNQPCPVSIADQNSGIQVDCVYNTAAWHYVLARMRSGDRHDNAASGEAREHYGLFFNILGLKQQADRLLMSPEEA